MRKIFLLTIILYLGGMIMSNALDKATTFMAFSPTLKNNETLPMEQVYKGFGCNGGNKAPELSWINAPENTKSFAIICHDPDAPRPNGWYHWLMVNIPSSVSSYKGTVPTGAVETVTDFNTTGYGGACPPVGHGVHRYNFTIYALDTEKLEVSKDNLPLEVEKVVKSHALAQTTITGLFERK